MPADAWARATPLGLALLFSVLQFLFGPVSRGASQRFEVLVQQYPVAAILPVEPLPSEVSYGIVTPFS